MQANSKTASRPEIAGRIERLNRDAPRLAPRELMQQLRAVRTLSHAGGLIAVAELAHALEDELVASGAGVAVHAYLDCMRDAVDIDSDAQPRFVDLALASIGAGWAFA